MYIYYDSNGTLKEFINDKALRKGNSNVNEFYVFWEGYSSSVSGFWYKFKLPDGTTYLAEAEYSVVEGTIPFSSIRDLKYFEYGKKYNFVKFTLPDAILSQDGSVLGSMWFTEGGNSVITMGAIAFNVDGSTLSVKADENINVAQWNELIKRMDTFNSFISGSFNTYSVDSTATGTDILNSQFAQNQRKMELSKSGKLIIGGETTGTATNTLLVSELKAGDIILTIQQNLSNYMVYKVDRDKVYLTYAKQGTGGSIDLTDFVTKQYLEVYVDEELYNYYDAQEIDGMLENLANYDYIEENYYDKNYIDSNYYNDGEVDNAITDALGVYYDKDYIDDNFVDWNSIITNISGVIDSTKIGTANAVKNYLSNNYYMYNEVDDMFKNYYTKEEINTAFDTLDPVDWNVVVTSISGQLDSRNIPTANAVKNYVTSQLNNLGDTYADLDYVDSNFVNVGTYNTAINNRYTKSEVYSKTEIGGVINSGINDWFDNVVVTDLSLSATQYDNSTIPSSRAVKDEVNRRAHIAGADIYRHDIVIGFSGGEIIFSITNHSSSRFVTSLGSLASWLNNNNYIDDEGNVLFVNGYRVVNGIYEPIIAIQYSGVNSIYVRVAHSSRYFTLNSSSINDIIENIVDLDD